MKPTTTIIQKVRRGVQTVAYGNPLYQKILASGETPDRLHFTFADLWPGDAQAGQMLITGQRSMFDNSSGVVLRQAAMALRNLRAVGTDAARQTSVRLIDSWLLHHDSWSQAEWAPSVLGERIAAWIGFYEFYGPAGSLDFSARLTESLHRQWKHLTRTMPSSLTGVANMQAIRGLIYGGLNFPEGEKALGLACELLQRQLAAEILSDGGAIARNPSAHLRMLQQLVEIRAIFKAATLEIPDAVQQAITVMVPVVKFYRHGDGGLALFHGGLEETALLIDAIVAQAEARSRVLRRLPATGYERITAGRGLLLVDAAAPPPSGHDEAGHAGLLSFEFGSGRERLIVNCGSPDQANVDWRMASSATAAHSTLTIEDTNACEVLMEGGLGRLPHVEINRYEQDGMECVDITHDGYRAGFGLTHQRSLSLRSDGEELRGRETLMGKAGKSYALRWHLHPAVQASLAQSGQGVLLRTASGNGWRLRVAAGALSLEPSIYCGTGTPRRSLQIKLSGITDSDQTSLIWSLTKEKKG